MIFFNPHEAKLAMIMFFTMLAAAFFVSCSSFGYIPSSQFIFDQVTDFHGKGTYSIDQEVLFTEGLNRLVVKETWLINNGEEMRVTANAEGFHTTRILKRGRIYWVDSDGSERADEMTSNYFMTLLGMRTGADAKKLLVKWQILPYEALRQKPLPKEAKDIKVESESFVRLGRVAGAIAYAYGKPSPPNGPANPGIWIEQDAFVIRKIRSQTGAEFNGNDYANYSKNFWYPKNQTISFSNRIVEIKTLRISSVNLTNDLKRSLEPSILRARNEYQTLWPQSGIAVYLQEFYKRFR